MSHSHKKVSHLSGFSLIFCVFLHLSKTSICCLKLKTKIYHTFYSPPSLLIHQIIKPICHFFVCCWYSKQATVTPPVPVDHPSSTITRVRISEVRQQIYSHFNLQTPFAINIWRAKMWPLWKEGGCWDGSFGLTQLTSSLVGGLPPTELLLQRAKKRGYNKLIHHEKEIIIFAT